MEEGSWRKVLGPWWLLPAYVAMLAGLFWFFGRGWLLFYGVCALGCADYYIGRAIINQAHIDTRPAESKVRRNIYQVVQVVVFIGIVWVISWIIGLDWGEVLTSE